MCTVCMVECVLPAKYPNLNLSVYVYLIIFYNNLLLKIKL